MARTYCYKVRVESDEYGRDEFGEYDTVTQARKARQRLQAAATKRDADLGYGEVDREYTIIVEDTTNGD